MQAYNSVEMPCLVLSARMAEQTIAFSEQAAASAEQSIRELLQHLQSRILSAGGHRLDHRAPETYLPLLQQFRSGEPLDLPTLSNSCLEPQFLRGLTSSFMGLTVDHRNAPSQQLRQLYSEAVLLLSQLVGLQVLNQHHVSFPQ